jgi:hypothetical protein
MKGRSGPSLPGPEAAAAYIARWRPSSVSPQAAAFARAAVTAAAPDGRERAKNLLRAAGRLADWATGLGLEPAAEVLLHPSVTERFATCAPGLSGPARRTLRTSLRFLARAVVPQLHPADAPLPRERAKAPCTPAQTGGYLALADAQPIAARRMRAAGLVCLGAGAGLIRADLRDVRGSDITCRSGGVIVTVRGSRPRAVPVLARYHQRLLDSAVSPAASWSPAAPDRTGTTSLTRWPARWPTGPGCPGWTPPGCAPPGWPAARSCQGWPRSCTPRGSPARSGPATSSPPWTLVMRPPQSRCSGRAPGDVDAHLKFPRPAH